MIKLRQDAMSKLKLNYNVMIENAMTDLSFDKLPMYPPMGLGQNVATNENKRTSNYG